MKHFLLSIIFLVTTCSVFAQPTVDYWQDVPAPQQARGISSYRYFTMNVDRIPQAKGTDPSTEISLPLPTGETISFSVSRSQLLAPGLAAKYPRIQTFVGENSKRGWVFRGDITANGFHGQILTPSETYYIDPVEGEENLYFSYARSTYVAQEPKKEYVEGPLPIRKKTQELNIHQGLQHRNEDFFAGRIRSYRIAIAATGEYTAYHGGTVEGGLSGITTTLNRVTGIYEKELGITFTLVDNNDKIVFTNAANDPYTNGNARTILPENIRELNNRIGNENFDIGHVFSTGSGGLAGLGVTCDEREKAAGTTGTSRPTGDAFDVDYVAHEIGHQMGAEHTFNGTQVSCGGSNRSSGTAFEPGSGSTIMGYANICGSDNIQGSSDDYFHVASIAQIARYTLIGNGLGCATQTTNGNQPPTANMPEGKWTIPANTPFALLGDGTDPDGDGITYCWEQFDLGPAGAPNAPTGNAPLFRSFSPTPNPERWFPRKEDLINGSTTLGENIPTYARNLNFMLTLRDGKGGVNYEKVDFKVAESDEVFSVTAPTQSTSATAGSGLLVTWNVAGTNLSPFSTKEVSITLSTNGGNTFPHVLAVKTANDGAEFVTIPAEVNATERAIIRVSAVGNIFFNISDGKGFKINNDTSPGFGASIAEVPAEACSPNDAIFTLSTSSIKGFSGDISVSVNDLPSGLTSDIADATLTPGESTTITIGNTASGTLGDNSFNISLAASGEATQVLEVPFTLIEGITGDITMLSPPDLESSVSPNPTFSWQAKNAASFYRVELSKDADFTTLIDYADSIAETTWKPVDGLDLDQTYFWRVRAVNSCNVGEYTKATFRTINLACETFTSTDVPVEITTAPGTFPSKMNVTGGFNPVYSVKVLDVDITHSWISDLQLQLQSPKGTNVILAHQPCNNEDNLFLSFGDNGEKHDNIPCPPADGGLYAPLNPLTPFTGENGIGTWQFIVVDGVNDDGGSLNGWKLEVCSAISNLKLTGSLASDGFTSSLSWTLETLDGVDGFEIQVSSDGGAFTSLTTLGLAERSFTHKNLTPGTAYQYRARTTLTDGSFGDFSNVVSITSRDVPPSAPSGLSVTSSLDYQTELAWTDNADNEDGFIIQRSVGDDTNFVTIDSIAKNIRAYIDPAQSHNSKNYYRVAAFNKEGSSDWTEIVMIVVSDLSRISGAAMSVYPNPGENSVTLSLTDVTELAARVSIVTMQGQVVQAQSWQNTNKALTLDTQKLPTGMYLIRVETEAGLFTHRWLKQ